ncbi:OmpH family outer membrane protein, partial [Desulfovibrio sp.]|uniref:OmpH family outer membrane protein n=1 Tax=Desulfovibrio sp. TaxID=885 RepID=UPI0023BC6AC4
MRTSRIIAPLLVGLFVLTGCQQQESQVAQPKIAIVDMGRVMRDSEPGKEGVKFLESQQAGMQAQLDAIQDRLEKNPKVEAAMQELQRVYAASQQRMQAEQQNVVNLLFDSVQRVINSYRESQGYDIILGAEAVASSRPGA